jgi:hypothetical protein
MYTTLGIAFAAAALKSTFSAGKDEDEDVVLVEGL